MSLIRKKTTENKTLINLCCAARLLNLDESTVRKGLCGTDVLTQIDVSKPFAKKRRISLILEEVIELKTKWIESSRAEVRKESRSFEPERNKLRLVR